MKRVNASRAKWLASLRPYMRVRLITPCGIHEAAIEELKDNRLWLLWKLGHACDLGYSATWVDPDTGMNDGGAYRIEPAEDADDDAF